MSTQRAIETLGPNTYVVSVTIPVVGLMDLDAKPITGDAALSWWRAMAALEVVDLDPTARSLLAAMLGAPRGIGGEGSGPGVAP